MCRNAVWLAVAPVLLALGGCGPSRPAVAPVTGQITIDGKPVTSGVVFFYPENGRMATGRIDTDGRYRLGTFTPTDGALPGDHRVVIESRKVEQTFAKPPAPLAELPADVPQDVRRELEAGMLLREKVTWLVAEKYAAESTTPLRATVSPGSNVIDLDLPAN